ncbi:hypothetical protein OG735_34730 [Streptomyces sp. NBC_01210]|uniref:hypothetical protein n=1 Tax=Streptomyces sp. NBC_01210 TaxID=2903774 RepID=UPI002E101163|nr:hypothetical protein OG735_34730 [Streptomyces sp. NBC_01210]
MRTLTPHQSPPVADTALVVHGGRRLSGSVRTSGFKHSLVTITAAAAAAGATVRIDNCPDIVETTVLSALFRALGGSAEWADGTLTLNASAMDSVELPAELSDRIHGSVYLLPALLSRAGRVRMPASGGCQIGEGPRGRPVEHFVRVLERFGASGRTMPDGGLEIIAPKLTGCTIDLLDHTDNRAMITGSTYSGATKTALLAAAVAHGTTTLHHLYPKPDVTDLIVVLRQLGADIEIAGPETVIVHGSGPEALRQDVRHTLVPDLIEVITWICAGVVLADSPLYVAGPGMRRATDALRPELDLLDRMGVRLETSLTSLTVHPAERPLRPVDFTAASRGVFSDSQPFFALLGGYATGPTTITEAVWTNRFGYVPGLTALGMRATHDRHVLRVDGPCPPHLAGQHLHATDLRAAAVLLLAALAVPGRTTLANTHHLDRGYRDLTRDLRGLGADIATTEKGAIHA